MIRRSSTLIISFLYQHGVLPTNEKELYVFGLAQGIRMLLNIITVLVIGCVMGMPWQSILFLSAFIPLRSYAGGFHAATPLRCYIYSILIIMTALYCIDLMTGQVLLQVLVTAISSLIILIYAPVESCNRKLTPNARYVYRKKTISWLFSLLTISFILCIVSQEAGMCLSMALTVTALLLLLGKLRYQITIGTASSGQKL